MSFKTTLLVAFCVVCFFAHGLEHDDLPKAQSCRNKQQKLEFVHITKTGGTAIVFGAAQAGVTWEFAILPRLFFLLQGKI
jgi:hypothetical protein